MTDSVTHFYDQRAELDAALQQAGLTDIRWHMPDESGLYQPVVSAHKR